MKFNSHTLQALTCVLAGALAGSAWAQTATKPAESTTKVKKVLLYNKIGGWRHVDGIADVKTVMTRLAAAKGFQLVQSEDETALTASNLATFQAIVWNNNTNGAGSVADAGARTAVMNYLKQGGGWLLIHGAGDHANSWADLTSTLGNSFTRHGNQGAAEFVIDNAAKNHAELKFMVQSLPNNGVVRLTDEWYSFQRTVRPLTGVTVVATARAVAGVNNVIVPVEDGSGDLTYIWARNVEKGRLLYNAVGHGQNQLMAQQDSVVTKFYWENLRYVAGDFQNGCTTVGNASYDANARVHDAAMCSQVSTLNEKTFRNNLVVAYGGMKTQLNFAHAETITAKVRDLRGAVVWQRTFTEGAAEIAVADGLKAGVYQLELRSGKSAANQRIVLR